MPKYQVEIWCPMCHGEDPQGCFDGGTMVLAKPYYSDNYRIFDTEEQAEHAALVFVDGGIWQYEIKEIPDASNP